MPAHSAGRPGLAVRLATTAGSRRGPFEDVAPIPSTRARLDRAGCRPAHLPPESLATLPAHGPSAANRWSGAPTFGGDRPLASSPSSRAPFPRRRPHRPPPAGTGSVVNRCGGGWSAVADAPSAPKGAAPGGPGYALAVRWRTPGVDSQATLVGVPRSAVLQRSGLRRTRGHARLTIAKTTRRSSARPVSRRQPGTREARRGRRRRPPDLPGPAGVASAAAGVPRCVVRRPLVWSGAAGESRPRHRGMLVTAGRGKTKPRLKKGCQEGCVRFKLVATVPTGSHIGG